MGSRLTLSLGAMLTVLVVSVLTGCQTATVEPSPVRSVGEMASTASVVTPAAERHDVGITAVDFEPPFQSGGEPPSDKLTLLVAVENKGNRPEKNLIVRVKITSTKDGELLGERASTVPSLVPGESKIVRFDSLQGLPLRPGYSLKTDIDAVPGENNLSNNSRSHLFQVTVTRKQ